MVAPSLLFHTLFFCSTLALAITVPRETNPGGTDTGLTQLSPNSNKPALPASVNSRRNIRHEHGGSHHGGDDNDDDDDEEDDDDDDDDDRHGEGHHRRPHCSPRHRRPGRHCHEHHKQHHHHCHCHGPPPPPPCEPSKGNILVQNTADNSTIGYINYDSTFGLAGTTTNQTLATVFTINTCNTTITNGTAGPFNILANWTTTEPYMGATQSFLYPASSPIQAGTGNYAWLSATAQTPPGSTPQLVASGPNDVFGTSLNSESDIWFLNTVTDQITSHWINPDNSTAPNFFVYAFVDNDIVITGDVAAYNSQFNAPSAVVDLIFLPAP